MPKVSKLQTSFSAGQISKSAQGHVDNPRYEQGLLFCQNYIPIVQGPLIRRPGTRYVANTKNPSTAPALIPFQFSVSQNYILELGGNYIRFYTNEGQVVTGTTQFAVRGLFSLYTNNPGFGTHSFWANRASQFAQGGETLATIVASAIPTGSILELFTPYAASDVGTIKWTQKQDTLYLTHPSYPPYKIQRLSATEWQIRPVVFTDGPYLPLNSYKSLGDSTATQFSTVTGGTAPVFQSSPAFQCSSVINNGSGAIRIVTMTAHNFQNGAKVMVDNVFGTVEANNIGANNCPVAFGSSTITACAAWAVNVINTTTIDLIGSTFTNAYVGSGFVYPAIFAMDSVGSWADCNKSKNYVRPLGVVGSNAIRYSYHLNTVSNASKCIAILDPGQSTYADGSSVVWQLGSYSGINGFPSCTTFHQDRLSFAGHSNIPQQIDLSQTGNYELFSASGSSLQVNNNNAIQFSLSSQDVNIVKWMKSTAQGLLCGTANSEWAISANTQTPALTPTNVTANQVTFFGSYDTDALPVNNSVLYIQRAGRKTRELLYYWQVGSYRSTNISELSESLTLPQITKLVNVKEPHPQVWGLRSDGGLLTAAYNRDDINFALTVGWAQHLLGGKSDSAGTIPVVTSLASIPSSDASYDELWMSVQRYINGTTVGTIEYMSKPFDDNTLQEDSYHFDCGVTFYQSSAISSISQGVPSQFTVTSGAFSVGQAVKLVGVIGPSFLNEQTYTVQSSISNTFYLADVNTGGFISIASSSQYVGGGSIAKKVTTISGLTWLAGESVGVLADGAIVVNTSVTASGVLTLSTAAAKVQIGYPYLSQGQMLRSKDGSAQGSSIGSTRRVNRVAFMLHNVGDFSFGPTFTNLIPAEFYSPDVTPADTAPPLFDGIHRDGIESDYGFSDTICFAQSSGLPGMIQAVTRFFEENDV